MPPHGERGRTLGPKEAARVYDQLAAVQDWQAFYENPALEQLSRYGRFEEAFAVAELGCGTGRFAQQLLSHRLPERAEYVGLDVSEVMVARSRERLAPCGERAQVHRVDGSFPLPLQSGVYDRFISTYVLDLLSEEDIRSAIAEAYRTLAPEGLICLASLTHGQGPMSRVLCRVWEWTHRWRPQLVGGCRPITLADYVHGMQWRVLRRDIVCAWGVCTDTVVAEKRG